MKSAQSKSRVLAIGLAALLLLTFGYTTRKTSAATTSSTSGGTPSVFVAPPAAAPSTISAAGAFANDDLDFDLVNKTGYDLKKVLISKANNTEWSDDDDVLNGRIFADGKLLHIHFSPKQHYEKWDMKVIYQIDGSSKEFDDLDLSTINKITLHYNADKDKTYTEIE